MCGIAGAASCVTERPLDGEALRAMLQRIVHRGPDDEGMYIDTGVALGVRRLSIIDVEGGHQPIHSEDERVWVVLNGEIYNYPQLRKELESKGHIFYTRTDTEALVHSYEEWGDDFVHHLNGMFALALWDKDHRKLVLARDRAGIKPLHYHLKDGTLLFASELKALLSASHVSREIDIDALNLYLSYEHVPTPRTIFQGISKLPPGHLLIFRDGQVTLKRYWDMDLSASEGRGPGDVREWREVFLAALEESVRMEMVSDVPLGVFLSGGIDSSAVAAMMQRAGGQVKSFSIAFDDPSFDESRYARLAAQHLGTDHHEEVLAQEDMWELVPKIADILDEPLGDSSIIPTYLLSRFARRRVTVALGGDGGDELLAGYSTLQAHRLADYYLKLPRPVRERLIAPLVKGIPVSDSNLSFDYRAKRFVGGAHYAAAERHHRWLGSFTPEQKRDLLRPQVKAALGDQDTYEVADNIFNSSAATNSLNRLLYMDMKLYMDTDILAKVDRASMACSLEVRVPFLNQVMLELMAKMPLEMKLRGFTRKYILRKAMKGVLPSEIINRGKKGFNIPVARWLKGELKPLALELLSESRMRSQGLFEPGYVHRLLQEHLSSAADNRKELWTLLVFQLWYDRYMTGKLA